METNLQRYTAILDDFWSAKKKFVKTSFLLKKIRFKRFFSTLLNRVSLVKSKNSKK